MKRVQPCQTRVQGRHVLAISDTSEINLQSDVGRIDQEGLGVVGDDRDLVFFHSSHPSAGWNEWLSLRNDPCSTMEPTG